MCNLTGIFCWLPANLMTHSFVLFSVYSHCATNTALLSWYSLATSSTLPGPNWHIVIRSRSRAILPHSFLSLFALRYPTCQILSLVKVYNIISWRWPFHCWCLSLLSWSSSTISEASCIPGDVRSGTCVKQYAVLLNIWVLNLWWFLMPVGS